MRDARGDLSRGHSLAGRWLMVLALLAAITVEAYYIVALRGTIVRQAEELRQISGELQSLRTERAALQEELTSTRRSRGEDTHEHTPER